MKKPTLKEVQELIKENIRKPKKLKEIVLKYEAILWDLAKPLREIIETVEKKSQKITAKKPQEVEWTFTFTMTETTVGLESEWLSRSDILIAITKGFGEMLAKIISDLKNKDRQLEALEDILKILANIVQNRLR